MTHTAKEQSAAYELTWSLSTIGRADGEQDLKLEYQLHAFEELYIGDRLWDYDAGHRRVPDPFGVYRFVRAGALRLVFAQAPLPRNLMPRTVYQPLFSRIPAGETQRKEILIKLPVDEYSALARDIDSPTVLEEVSRVFFVLSYRLRSTLDSDPTPPPFESPEEAGYIVHTPQLIISSLDLDPNRLPINRRIGEIARFSLPGEPESD
jgi:hypothetical protein